MGSTETKPLFSSINSDSSLFRKTFAKSYELLKEIKDPNLGECQVFKHKSRPELVISKSLSEIHAQNGLIFTDFSRKNDSFLAILHLSSTNEQIFCGSGKQIAIYCEYFSYTLEKELQRRAKDMEFLNESELWYILNTLISCGAVLQAQNQYFNGFLSVSTIFLTEKGHLKLMPPLFFAHEPTHYVRILSNYKEKGLLSPALLQCLREKQLFARDNKVKSDVFICGLIVLYAASLCNVGDFFDYKQKIFNFQDCLALLTSLRNKYSQLFINILIEMIQENEEYRPDFQELEIIMKNNKPQDFSTDNSASISKENVYYMNNFQQYCVKSPIRNGFTANFSTSYLNNSPEIIKFRPVFVSPQRIYSPTMKILYESPASEPRNAGNNERFLEEIKEELRNMRENIENALERTTKNINKYKEILSNV